MQVGDVYLLCCDGLTDMVDDWILREVMHDATMSGNLEEACDSLVRAALSSGGSTTRPPSCFASCCSPAPRRDLSPQPVSRLFSAFAVSQYAFI